MKIPFKQSAEDRLSAWIRIRDSQKRLKTKTPFTITISRQFGCQGFPLAEALKDLLEEQTQLPWVVFEKTLFDKICEDANFSQFFEDLGVQPKLWDHIISPLMKSWKVDQKLFQRLAESIWRVAERGQAIIVGRGGASLTQSLSNCIHVKLNAPLEFRIDSISDRLKISKDEAAEIINEGQIIRDQFLKSFLQGLPELTEFDLILNNSKITPATMARIILPLIQK